MIQRKLYITRRHELNIWDSRQSCRVRLQAHHLQGFLPPRRCYRLLAWVLEEFSLLLRSSPYLHTLICLMRPSYTMDRYEQCLSRPCFRSRSHSGRLSCSNRSLLSKIIPCHWLSGLYTYSIQRFIDRSATLRQFYYRIAGSRSVPWIGITANRNTFSAPWIAVISSRLSVRS